MTTVTYYADPCHDGRRLESVAAMGPILREKSATNVEDYAVVGDAGVLTVDSCAVAMIDGALTIVFPDDSSLTIVT